MGSSAVRIGAVRGIEVRIDISWLLIAVLVTWSYWDRFDARDEHAGAEAFLMALAAAALFFGSVLAHELAHSLEASAVVLLVMLAACTNADDRPSTAGGNGEPTTAPKATASMGERDGGTAAADGTVDDEGPLGSAGSVLLDPRVATAVVEVDRSPAADIAVDARAVIDEKLAEHGGKRSVRAAGDSQVPAKRVYSEGDLRAIAAASRSQTSTRDEPATYVLVLEGRYENERVTGVAFQATAFAVFPEQVGGGLLGINRDTFERALVVHELGHLFGLVNLTGQGGFHEDPEHPGHSTNRGSVMYWAVEDVSVRNLFSGGPPTEFDEADRQEMSRIRGS